MIGQSKIPALGNVVLERFDRRVLEFLNLPTLQAHQMVVVVAPVQFKNGSATFEMMPNDQAGGFKLGQHPVNRCEADFLAFGMQFFQYFYRTQVALAKSAPTEAAKRRRSALAACVSDERSRGSFSFQ